MGRDVVVHVIVVPGRDRVHLHHLARGVPSDDGRIDPFRSVDPLEACDPRAVTLKCLGQGSNLAHLTAAARATGKLVYRYLGMGDHEVELVAFSQALDICERLGEMELGVEEDDLHRRVDLDRHVDQRGVLKRCGQGDLPGEAVHGPLDYLHRVRRIEAGRGFLELGQQLRGDPLVVQVELHVPPSCSLGHDRFAALSQTYRLPDLHRLTRPLSPRPAFECDVRPFRHKEEASYLKQAE